MLPPSVQIQIVGCSAALFLVAFGIGIIIGARFRR